MFPGPATTPPEPFLTWAFAASPAPFSPPALAARRGACSVATMKPATRAAAATAAAGLASFAYQKVAEARDRRRFPPPGRLVDIGGRCLHLVEMGEGSPAVIIIPALGESVLGWLHILQGAAAEAQACIYDRAEIGWSDPPPHWRRTPDVMAADLHALLSAAGIPAPYVLVGHSIGGIVARSFYAQYPGHVAGMLLVDSSHEQQVRRFAEQGWRRGPYRYAREAATTCSSTSRTWSSRPSVISSGAAGKHRERGIAGQPDTTRSRHSVRFTDGGKRGGQDQDRGAGASQAFEEG